MHVFQKGILYHSLAHSAQETGSLDTRCPVRNQAEWDGIIFWSPRRKAMLWSFLEVTHRHSKDRSIQENGTGSHGARDGRTTHCEKNGLRGMAGRTQGSLVQAPNAMCKVSIKSG